MLNASFRSAEMTALKRHDLNLTTGKLMVRQGKGSASCKRSLAIYTCPPQCFTRISLTRTWSVSLVLSLSDGCRMRRNRRESVTSHANVLHCCFSSEALSTKLRSAPFGAHGMTCPLVIAPEAQLDSDQRSEADNSQVTNCSNLL